MVHGRAEEEPGRQEDPDQVLRVAEVHVGGAETQREREVEKHMVEDQQRQQEGPRIKEGTPRDEQAPHDQELDDQAQQVVDQGGERGGQGQDAAREEDLFDEVGVPGDAFHARLDGLDGELPGEDADDDLVDGHARFSRRRKNM